MLNRYTLNIKNAIRHEPFGLSVNHRIILTQDSKGIATALAELLQQNGYRHCRVVDQTSSETEIAAADALIILDGLTNFSSAAEAIAVNRQAFLYAHAIADRFTQKGGLFITVQDTGGQFGFTAFEPTRAWSAGLAGLTKTAAHEWPKAVCQAIDLQQSKHTPAQIAQRLLKHLLHGCSEIECGLPTDGKQVTIDIQTAAINATDKLKLKKDSVLVVSGGGRGVTAACLIEFTKQYPAKIVLLGRTALNDEPDFCKPLTTEAQLKQAILTSYQAKKEPLTPANLQQQVNKILAVREIKATVAALQAASIEVIYKDVDILNAEQLTNCITQIRQDWKKITGIIHGAGVLADKLISQKTEQQFDTVFNTKVIGLKNLLDATREDKLELIALFSSVAARFGNSGQCDYAMANEILNKVAHAEQQRRGNRCLVKSYNWGPWESGMVTPQLKTLFAQRGIELLPIKIGTQMFVDELRDSSRNNVEIVLGGTLETPKSFIKSFAVSEKIYPFLTSHVIENAMVIPVCLVLEWFIRTAKVFCPHLIFNSCQNLKVLRGVRLPNIANATENFTVQCDYLENSATAATLSLKLFGPTHVLHYSAQIIMRAENPKIVLPNFNLVNAINWPNLISDIYQINHSFFPENGLFHGPDLQGIEVLEKFSAQGGSGQVKTMQQKKWGDDQWQTDLLTLDGALQLLVLWSSIQIKNATLPTQISELILYSPIPKTNSLKCQFVTVIKGKYRTVSDVLITYPDGRPYASLHGVELFAIQIKEQPQHV